MKKNIIAILLESIFNNTYIYPKGIQNSDGSITKRTKYQDGWNAAVIQVTTDLGIAENYFHDLEKIQRNMIIQMLNEEYIELIVSDNNITLELNINDAFCYGFSDSELLDIKNLQFVHSLWMRFDYDGIVAWVANKRKTDPLEIYKSKKYYTAIAELKQRDEYENII